MVVEAYEWVSHGANRFTVDAPSGASKTKVELAKEANVGKGSIDRAKQVSHAGRSAEVISGENSASAVIQEEREKVAPVEQKETLPIPEPVDKSERFRIQEEREKAAANAPDFFDPERILQIAV